MFLMNTLGSRSITYRDKTVGLNDVQLLLLVSRQKTRALGDNKGHLTKVVVELCSGPDKKDYMKTVVSNAY